MNVLTHFAFTIQILVVQCNPQLNASNKCFLIKGAISVAKQSTDSSEAIISSVRNITESVMAGNNLLSSKYNDVKSISYVKAASGTGGVTIPVGEAQGSQEVNRIKVSKLLLIGSLIGAAVLLMGVAFANRRGNLNEDEETSDSMFGTTVFPGLDSNESANKLDVVSEESETDENEEDDRDDLIMITSLSVKESHSGEDKYDNCCNIRII